MYDLRDPYDDEEERDRIARELMGVSKPGHVPITEERDAPRTGDMPAPAQPRHEPHEHEPANMVDKDGFDWEMVGALLLDLGLNRGRGGGQIVGAYANNREASKRQKQAHKLRLEEIAARKGDRDMEDWRQTDASQRDWEAQGLRQQEINLSKDSFGLRKDTREDKLSPDTDASTTKTELVKRGAAARVRGAEEEKDELAETIAGNVANVATARSKAVTDEARNNPKDLTKAQIADDKRADEAAALRQEMAGVKADLDKEKNARAGEALHLKTKKEFDTAAGHMVQVAAAARKLENIFKGDEDSDRRDKLGQRDYHGIGTYDSMKHRSMRDQGDSDASAELDILRSWVQGPITGAAVGGKDESGRINALAGQATGLDEQSARTAIKALNELARNSLRQHAAGREDAARESLAAHGLDDILGPKAAPQIAPPPPKPTAQPGLGKLTTPMKNNVQLGADPDEDELEKLLGGLGGRRVR